MATLATGCAGSGGGGGGGPTKPSCTPPATRTVCFQSNIQPIFNKYCALAGCHSGTPAAQNLDLSASQSYKSIVGVPAVQQPHLKLVKPGDPNTSYLVQKILDPAARSITISGIQMPQGCPGAPKPPAPSCMDPSEQAAVTQWVTECATNSTPCP